MTIEQNKEIVRRYRQIHNANDLDALDQIVAKDIESHNGQPGFPPGLEGGKMAHRGFLAAFPDSQTKTEDLIAEGDKVLERYTAWGTHTGPFMGMPATGKQYKIESWVIHRIAGGKIVEQWGINDGVTLLMQLGALPAPA